MNSNHHKTVDIYDALVALENKDEAMRFVSDLCTPRETKALKERWRVVQLLANENLSYREIHDITGASLTTIGRVARFLKEESYMGYKTILNKFKEV